MEHNVGDCIIQYINQKQCGMTEVVSIRKPHQLEPLKMWYSEELNREWGVPLKVANTLIDQANYILVLASKHGTLTFWNTRFGNTQIFLLRIGCSKITFVLDYFSKNQLADATIYINISISLVFVAFRFRIPNYKHPYKSTPRAPCFSLCSVPHSNISFTNRKGSQVSTTIITMASNICE